MTRAIISEIQVGYKLGLGSSTTTITNSQNAYEIFKSLISADTISLQEQFVVLYLNRANRVIGSYQLSKGGITGTIADFRLILSILIFNLFQ
jgi:DNA repair protein RadC